MVNRRKRKLWSVKNELLTKAREAMLCAVQIFNNPNVVFKSESFIVLSSIAWTYLLHSYYKQLGIDFRYFDQKPHNKRYHKTQKGTFKYWELERCLNEDKCPLDIVPKSNLRFLIGLRHEIEHQMTTRIDDYLSARFQACCLNFNHYIKKLFGEEYGIDKHLSFSLQFSSISDEQVKQLKDFSDLPKNIASFINAFDETITDEEFNNPQFSYRVLYVPKTANRKGQADRVIEFIKPDSPEAQGLNKEYVILRDREKPKFYAKEVISQIKAKGYNKFGIYQHTQLWQQLNARDEGKGYGVWVGGLWFWYESWIKEVERYCNEHKSDLR